MLSIIQSLRATLARSAWCCVALLASLPQLTLAQQESDDEGVLDEIIVTTQRRAENLQQLPLAVTAFSGEELEAMGIVDLKGITERTPGFTMGEFNPGQTQLYVRGIGSNEDGAGGDQSVVVFIDEVYVGRSAGQDVDLFDIERVEVLRGPQGTLFGRNVVGGAVNIITSKPTEEPELVLEGSIGNYDLMTLRGRASGQIAESLYGKFSFSSRNRDGYLENRIGDYASVFEGPDTSFEFDKDDKLRKINRDSFRGSVRWVASDIVEVNVGAAWSTLDEFGAVRHFISGATGASLFAADSQLIPNYASDIHAVLTDSPGQFKNDIWSVTARVDWDVTDSMTFTSLSGFREVDGLNNESGLGTDRLATLRLSTGVPLALSGSNSYTDFSETFTQELRLSSSGESRWQWVGGLYFLQEDTLRTESTSLNVHINDPAGVIQTNPGNLPASDQQDNDTTSYAAFGQVSYDLTDELSVIVGGRWTSDEKTNDRLGTPSPAAPTRDFDVRTTADWNEFTGKFGINYVVSDDVFLYGTVSEGYKAGGFQGLAGSVAQASTPFNPEFATLYEFGGKTEWFDNRLRLNLAIFQTDYEDLQILQLLVPDGAPPGDPGQLVTQNAADAEISGVELEFTAAVTDNFLLQGSVTSLDTEFKDFFAPPGFTSPGGGAAGQSRIGNDLRNAPDLAYNLTARYTMDMNSGASLIFQADHRHKDEVNQDPDNLPEAFVPEYDLTDARVTWINSDGNFELAWWVTNLFDEDYFVHNFPALGDGLATAGPPRMYGATVTFRYE